MTEVIEKELAFIRELKAQSTSRVAYAIGPLGLFVAHGEIVGPELKLTIQDFPTEAVTMMIILIFSIFVIGGCLYPLVVCRRQLRLRLAQHAGVDISDYEAKIWECQKIMDTYRGGVFNLVLLMQYMIVFGWIGISMWNSF